MARRHDVGVTLGPHDRPITWERPQRPEWMDEVAYADVPATVSLREVRAGDRLLVTTLSDPNAVWPYCQRWHIELDFRAIQCVMQMDILRSNSVDMVLKEIAAHLLG